MTWTRLEDTFAEHPVLKSAGPLASWLHVAALCYSNRNLTDGFVPRDRVRRLTAIDDPDEHAEQLMNVGAWQRVDGGFRIVHHLEFQPTADSVRHKRKLSAERQRRWREPDKKSGRYVDASSNAPTDASGNASPDPPRNGGSRARDATPTDATVYRTRPIPRRSKNHEVLR